MTDHNKNQNIENNKNEEKKVGKSAVREWVESIIIAFILAMFIRTFFIQAFKIPSGSMRMTLIERDRLMVNKLRYGPKVPFVRGKRLPGYSDPQRGDIIVFAFPDSTLLTVNDIDQWGQFLNILKNPTHSIHSNALERMNKLIQDRIRETADLNSLSVPIRRGMVSALNNLKSDENLFFKLKDTDAILKNNKKLKKWYDRLVREHIFIENNGQLTLKKNLTFAEKSDVEWLNLGLLKQIFPHVISKKLIWEEPKRDFIKRLIAFGGETVEIREGDIYINGTMVEDPVIKNFYYYNRFDSEYGKDHQVVKVPDGAVFVLGDNSASSHDSRFWGFVPEENIIGRAELIYWPFKRMRLLK